MVVSSRFVFPQCPKGASAAGRQVERCVSRVTLSGPEQPAYIAREEMF